MNVDQILETLSRHQVDYLLIGGMNFLLRHQGPVTYDVDVWIDDTDENRERCERALAELGAEWGRTEADWAPVARSSPGWLARQGMFCLHTTAGAVDVFRSLEGPSSWAEAKRRAVRVTVAAGIECDALCDADMLACQLALPEGQRRQDRLDRLRQSLEKRHDTR